MDVTKPYKFTGFGAMDVTKPYKFTGFGAMDAKDISSGFSSYIRSEKRYAYALFRISDRF